MSPGRSYFFKFICHRGRAGGGSDLHLYYLGLGGGGGRGSD